MFRFTVKAILYATALAAAYCLVWTSAVNKSTLSSMVGIVLIGALVIGYAYCAGNCQSDHDGREKEAREADESNPTT